MGQAAADVKTLRLSRLLNKQTKKYLKHAKFTSVRGAAGEQSKVCPQHGTSNDPSQSVINTTSTQVSTARQSVATLPYRPHALSPPVSPAPRNPRHRSTSVPKGLQRLLLGSAMHSRHPSAPRVFHPGRQHVLGAPHRPSSPFPHATPHALRRALVPRSSAPPNAAAACCLRTFRPHACVPHAQTRTQISPPSSHQSCNRPTHRFLLHRAVPLLLLRRLDPNAQPPC